MKNHRTDAWIQIASTAAVLVGVALVVTEIRQNSELVELQILKQSSDNFVQYSLSLLPENIYEIRQKSMDDPENLTHLEYRALDSFYWSMNVTQWRSLYDMAERGLVNESAWRRMVQDEAPVYLGYPFGRAWWSLTREEATTVPEELVIAVDEALAVEPSNVSADTFRKVIDRLELGQQ